MLGQAFAHCPIVPTAASRRSLDRISVPMWPANLSVRLSVFALVGRYPANQLIRREPIFQRIAPLVSRGCPQNTLCGISSRFQLLSPSERQVAHTLLTRPPLSHSKQAPSASFDLHVLGTPPAFVLSQDQTLNKFYLRTLSDLETIYRSLFPALKEISQNVSVLQEPFLVLICISFTLFNLQGAHRFFAALSRSPVRRA